jgi:hypothetical protein
MRVVVFNSTPQLQILLHQDIGEYRPVLGAERHISLWNKPTTGAVNRCD